MTETPVKTGAAFPRIPSGQHGLAPELVSADQRARLHAAIVQVVAATDYAATTVEDVLTRAGVSRRTFYELYENKLACFLAAVDDVAADWVHQGTLAYEEQLSRVGAGDALRARLCAGLLALFGLVLSDPLGARILFIETLNSGSGGLRRREQAIARLEQIVEQTFIAPTGQAQLSSGLAKVIVGGVLEIITVRLRTQQADELSGLAEPLVQWMLSYRSPNAASAMAAARARLVGATMAVETADRGKGGREGETGSLPLWRDESVRPIPARDPRARIVEAAAQIASDYGYAALSINEIDRVAGVSHHTFRRFFDTKREAFIAAYREGGQETIEYCLKAYVAARNWKAAVHAGLAAELRFLAMRPALARIGFLEIYAAGPGLLELRETELGLFTAALEPGYRKSRRSPPPHEVFSEAIAGGIYQLIRELVLHHGPERLPELAPEATFAALAPFTGANAASAEAVEPVAM
jgi:AcrR family transcriptional regulator